MELQTSDSKKLFKVFDASKRKRAKKKREGHDETNSLATDDSNSAYQPNVGCIMSDKTSLQDLPTAETADGHPNGDSAARERVSSSSIPRDEHRSPRRHRRPPREGLSLALKAGMVSTPRSISPTQDLDVGTEAPTQDHDSLIYAFLEEAIKRDKKKHRHGRRHEEHRSSREARDREVSESREHRHRHRRRHDDLPSRDRDKHRKESPSPAIDQTVLLETFAKLCTQMNEKNLHYPNINHSPVRTQSHKSLQCEVVSRRDLYNVDRRPERLSTHENDTPTRIRSQENCRQKRDKTESRHEKCNCYLDKDPKYDSKVVYNKESKYTTKIDYEKEAKYSSKIDVNRSRAIVSSREHEDERYRTYPPEPVATRTFIDHYRDRPRDNRGYRDYDRRNYEDDKRRYCEQKTSRSFEVHRDGYEEDRCRRTSRSETKAKRYDEKYYERPILEAQEKHFPPKDRRTRRPSERFDRTSIGSREEEYRERDRYSERERDSGMSVADGETSTISGRTGRSNYLKVVKQEISEQREAMDKMMKLWKELMRCFKGISQSQDKDKTLKETACESVRESAAAQLRLWRECMRRYETVARDVGDTDARLMEEINKQRSEMSEMATMWQECLQRYRDMSNDFNTLKQQLATAESPTRLPAPAPAPACAEGEGSAPAPHYRMPLNYPQLPPTLGGGYAGSPLRGRASAPPAWWWGGGGAGGGGGGAPSPRHRSSRRSSPDSRDGRDRSRPRRHKDARDVPRYKEKSSKPAAARSEHRRRKR